MASNLATVVAVAQPSLRAEVPVRISAPRSIEALQPRGFARREASASPSLERGMRQQAFPCNLWEVSSGREDMPNAGRLEFGRHHWRRVQSRAAHPSRRAGALLVIFAAVAGVVFSSNARAAVEVSSVVGIPLDIEIAIDGTGSMGPSIERARRNAHEIVEAMSGVLPNTRFAVVVFRDFGSTGEYEVLQPLTFDSRLVESAFSRVMARTNGSAGNGFAESYNLLFRMSYTDQQLEWRPSAKKLVVVIGDAEPQSAGAVGLSGCRDTAPDQHELNTRSELANMRAAGRALLMIRQVAPQTSASLSCYQSLAAGAAAGGAAVDTGEDLVSIIVALVQRAFAPIALRSDRAVVRRGALVRFTVTMSNATNDGAPLENVALTLPAGFVYQRGTTRGGITREPTVNGRTLVWRWQWGGRTLKPSERLLFGVSARVAATRSGRYRARARAIVQTPYGERLTSLSMVCWITVRRPPAATSRSSGT